MGAKEPGQSFLDKIFRKKDDNVTDEIKNIVQEGHQQGELLDSEAEMITNIIEFGDKEAHDIMTHRKNIVAIDADTTIKDCFEFVLGENYSRFPVYEGDIDHIIGVMHLRDLLKIYADSYKGIIRYTNLRTRCFLIHILFRRHVILMHCLSLCSLRRCIWLLLLMSMGRQQE